MSHTITIATWNVERPSEIGARNAVIIKQLREVNADIWVLTETNEAIVPSADHQHCAASPVLPLRNPGERTTMIWSRWAMTRKYDPFSWRQGIAPAAETVYPSYTVRGPETAPATCVEIATPLGPLLVYGTVITWWNDKGPAGTSGYGVEHLASLQAHRQDWERLGKALPLCVAGDFNATLNGPVSYGTCAGRAQLVEALDTNRLMCVTTPFHHAIDHICLTWEWAKRVRQVRRWPAPQLNGTAVSDHPGVSVELWGDL